MNRSAGDGTKGSLIIVGTGIRIAGQLTTEAIACMKRADRLLYLVGDPISVGTIEQINPAAEPLGDLYAEGKPRIVTYQEMVERILNHVRAGRRTCVAVYGHPGVFVLPSHEAIRRARAEGFSARMLPGISAEDCLFADLGVDPATDGCQSFEATDFLLHGRRIDPTAAVVLWQVGVVGDPLFRRAGFDLSALPLLVDRLLQFYPPDHVGLIYEASLLPVGEPSVRPTPIAALSQMALTSMSTLYIPPSRRAVADPVILGRMRALMAGAGARGWRADEPAGPGVGDPLRADAGR